MMPLDSYQTGPNGTFDINLLVQDFCNERLEFDVQYRKFMMDFLAHANRTHPIASRQAMAVALETAFCLAQVERMNPIGMQTRSYAY